MKPKFNLQSLRRHRRILSHARRHFLAPAATVWLFVMSPSHAQIWDGSESNSFGLAQNWANNTLPSSSLANTELFFGPAAGSISPSVDVPAFSVRSINFISSSEAYKFSGNAFNIGLDGIVNGSSQTITFGNAINFSGVASSNIGVAAGGVIAFNNLVTMATDTLSLSGSGLVMLGSTGSLAIGELESLQANTNLTLDGGQLTRSAKGDLSIAAFKTLTVQKGGDMAITGGFTNDTESTITITGSGSTFSTSGGLILSGGSTFNVASGGSATVGTGAVTLGEVGSSAILNVQTGGTFSTSTNTLTLDNNGTLNLDGGTLNINGAVAYSGGDLNFNSGRVNVNVPFTVGTGGALGSNLTLAAGKTLATGGTATVDATRTLAIGTGTYSALGDLTVNGTLRRDSTGVFTLAAGKTMMVQNGGAVEIFGAFTQNTASTISVTGATSSFGTTSTLRIEGGGTMNVLQGASVNAGTAGIRIGSTLLGGDGTVNVNGTGSSLRGGDLDLGTLGDTGTLMLGNGGSATVGNISVAGNFPSGEGVLSVLSGSSLTGENLLIASSDSPTTGAVTVDGVGSTLTLTGASTATIGAAATSTATLALQNSGTFSTGTGTLTLNPTGTLNVSGGILNINGSIAHNGGALNLNSGTVNTNVSLVIGNGGVLASGVTLPAGMILNSNGGTTLEPSGTLNLTGGTFNVASTFSHNGGTLNLAGGILNVQSGGTFNTPASPTTYGSTVNVSGGTLNLNGAFTSAGGTLNFTSGTVNANVPFTVGTGGALGEDVTLGSGRTLNTISTATVDAARTLDVGLGNYNAQGDLTVNGTLTRSSGGTFTVAAGKTLTVQNGGDVNITGSFTNNAANEIEVTGEGSTFAATSGIFLGGDGITSVLAGGSMSVPMGGSNILGVSNVSGAGNGTILVDGSGSNLSAGTLILGFRGNTANATFSDTSTGTFGSIQVGSSSSQGTTGTLSITSGASVTANDYLNIAGTDNLNTGTVTITGVNSALTITGAGATIIGAAGASTGTLNIQTGGTFSTGTETTTLNATGTLNLAGGTLNLNGAFANNGGTVTFNNGTLNVNSGGTFQSGTNPITAGTGSFIAINGGTYSSEGDLTLDGGQLTRDASGSFTLSAGKTLAAQNGGIVNIYNGYRNQSASTVSVTGLGSQFNVVGSGSGGMIILEGGSILNALDGGSITAPFEVWLGYTAGSGTLLADGSNSSLTTGGVRVGTSGKSGFLTFSNSASGTLNSIRLSETGTTNSHGTLHISGESSVTGTSLSLASVSAINTGTVTISGTNSSLTLSGSDASTIGAASASTAILNIEDGGTFSTNTGTTTLNTTGTINLDGGNFVQNGSLVRNGGALNFTSGTFTANVPFVVGSGGALGTNVTLGSGKTLNTSSTATIDAGRKLFVSDGTYNVLDSLTVNGQLTHSASGSFNLASGSSLTLQNGGDVSLAAESFSMGGAGAASILVTGGGSSFNGVGVNIGSGSAVTIQNGGSYSSSVETQLLSGGAMNLNQASAAFGVLVHGGSLNITGGSVGITGDIFQSTGSSTTLSGNSTATFQDIYQRDAGTFTVQSGSTAIFNGAVSGPGGFDGAGTVEFHGSYSPGSSPGIVNIAGNAVFGSGNTLNMEIGGLTPGTQHDRINVGGNTTLGGAVNLAFTSNTFFPQIGNSFVIMDTGGTFTDSAVYSASGLRSGWQFSTDYNAGTGELTVTSLSKGVPLDAAIAPEAVWNTNAIGNWSDATKWNSNPHVPNNGNNNSVYNVTQNNGTVTVDQVIDIDAYRITGGTNTGGAGTLNLSGKLTWETGTFDGNGIINANAGADLALNTFHNLNSRTMNLGGSSTWSGGPFQTGSGATLNVLNGASFDTSFDGGITNTNGGAMSAFNNAGAFTKSAGSGITDIKIGFNSSSTATVNVNSGTLRFNENGSHAGDYSVASGATLHFAGGTHTLESGISFGGAGTTRISNVMTANADVVFTSPLTLEGTINGGGVITVNGPMTWNSGAIGGGGASTHTFNINGGLTIGVAANNFQANHDLSGRTLNLAGNTLWTHPLISTGNSAIINNLSGAVFTTNFNGTMDNALGGGAGTFNNHGTFTKSSGTGVSAFSGVAFNNTATAVVNADSGILSLAGGGTQSGTFNVAAGATLRFGGTQAIGAGTTINDVSSSTVEFASGNASVTPQLSLAGTLKISGGTATMNGAADVATLLITGGTLNGSGNIAVSGTMTWSDGTISGTNSATDVLTANGPVIIDQVAYHDIIGRTLTINGNTSWTGSPIRTGSAAVINNNGVFSSTTAGTISNDFGVAASAFNNAGTFQKSAGTTTTISIAFNNTGTVNVSSGAGSGLTLSGSVPQHSGTTLAGGTWNVSNSSTLNFSTGSNIQTIGAAANVTLDGVGSTFAKINTLNNNQGGFTVRNGRDFTTGGNLANSGTVRIEGTTTLIIGASGSGVFTQSAGETLLSGNSQLTASAVNVNGGIVVVGTDGTSTLTSTVTVNDGGTLSGSGTIIGNVTVNSGGVHAPGNSPGIEAVNGHLNYNSSSIFEWDLNANTVTQSGGSPYLFDQVTSTGGHTLTVDSGAIFRIVLGTGVDLDDPFWSTPYISQTWSNIFTGFSSLVGGFSTSNIEVTGQSVAGYGSFSISGTALTWSAVPEPTTALAGVLLGAGLLRRRRVPCAG